jgi:hypothetical protein
MKSDIVMQRCMDLGIEMDIEAEKKRRFNRFLVVHDPYNNEETYWFNDGSVTGLRIVTFNTI